MTVLYRCVQSDLALRAGSDGDQRIVEGIAVPYNRVQRIDDGLVEQFAPGAFAAQLGKPWKIRFWREHQALGGVLIGKAVELRDDPAGLWGAFRLAPTVAGEDTLTLIREGMLDELSIGFREGRNRRLEDGTVERTRAHLTEVASVVAGAYGQHAKVLATRAAAPALDVDLDSDGATVADESAEAERVRVAAAMQILARLTPPVV